MELGKWKLVVVTIVLLVASIYGASKPVDEAAVSQEQVFSKGNYTATPKKPLSSVSHFKTEEDYGDGGIGDDNDDGSGSGSMNRIGVGAPPCSKDNILVFQGATSPMPNGIPTYFVQVENVCVSGSCSISGIHLSCGWFSSARTINPSIFRRIRYDDCLVNDGKPLNPGEAVTFQYANTFKYPMSVSSVDC